MIERRCEHGLRRRKGAVTFAGMVAVAEVMGESLTRHVDRAFPHVAPLARSSASYYPFLLVGVKIVGALTLAALLARGCGLGCGGRGPAAAPHTTGARRHARLGSGRVSHRVSGRQRSRSTSFVSLRAC